jgi:hypothetical protein
MEYVRLSQPDGESVKFALFPYSDRPPLVNSALPATIKTKLQSPDGIPVEPNVFRKFGGPTRDITLHKDTFGGEMKTALGFVNDDSFQWYLNVKSSLAFTHEPQGHRSGELDTQSNVQLARQDISEAINTFTTNIDVIRQKIGELEKPRPTSNTQEKKQDEEQVRRLNYQVESMDKKKFQFEQLLKLLDSFQQRTWSLAIQQEYEDGDQILIVPILNTEAPVDGQSNAAERFQ